MIRLRRCRHIFCRSGVRVAYLFLLLVFLYGITRMKLISQSQISDSVAHCIDDSDDYYFLKADMDNQRELDHFIESHGLLESVRLILIDPHVLGKLLQEHSISTHSFETGDFFQFAVQQKDWHCLEASMTNAKKEWLFEVAESAIALQHNQNPKIKILVRKLIEKTVDYQVLLPYSGRFLQTDQRTIAFVRIKSMLQIALNSATLLIPSNPRLFLERFNRGHFIDCKNPTNDHTEPQHINKKAIADLANIRDFFEQLGAMFHLECGTLLGWYRDCSIIEYTTDLDISVPIEYYSEAFNRSIFSNDLFRVWKQWGKVNDSLELATFLGPFGQGEKLDIFFNYNAANYTFTGGFGLPDYVLRYELPKRDGYCSGDLYGHLFTVPCNIEEWMRTTYGDDFMTKKAPKSQRVNGTYTKALNTRVIGRSNQSDVSITFFKHPKMLN